MIDRLWVFNQHAAVNLLDYYTTIEIIISLFIAGWLACLGLQEHPLQQAAETQRLLVFRPLANLEPPATLVVGGSNYSILYQFSYTVAKLYPWIIKLSLVSLMICIGLELKTSGAMRMYWVYGPDRKSITIEPHPEDKKSGAYTRIPLSDLPMVSRWMRSKERLIK